MKSGMALRAFVFLVIACGASAFACASTEDGGVEASAAGPASTAPASQPTGGSNTTPPAPAPTKCDDAAPPQSDSENCGRCGHSCLGGQCAVGECRPYAVASGLKEAPIAIAIDAVDVYWIGNQGSVMKCPLAGCLTPTVIVKGQGAALSSIAIDGTHVYFTDFGTQAADWKNGSIVRVTKAGADVTVLAESQDRPGGIVADGTHVYWVETNSPGRVSRCAATGCALTPEIIASGRANPSAPIVDADSIYWGDQLTGEIAKSDKSKASPAPAPLLGGQGTVLATALDATSLYFAQFASPGKIVRVAKDGSNVVELAKNVDYSESVAVDDARVYWATTSSVWSADKLTGASPKQIGAGTSAVSLPRSLHVDATSVVWCENNGARIVRLAK